MSKRAAIFVIAASLCGCAAKMTLIDRTDGQRYTGSTDGTTMGASGEATIDVEGEKYTGPWIYQPNGGSFNFSGFSSQTSYMGFGNSTNQIMGNTSFNLEGNSQTKGSGFGISESAVGNGMLNVRSSSGKFMRCIFTFHTMKNTGIGECLRNDGRAYDLMLKR
jgi:hypothetical protein